MKKNLTNLFLSIGLCSAGFAQTLQTGPSTTTTPYMFPTVAGGTVVSILTAGDVVGGYTLSGLGDGMGVIENGGSTYTVLINHEAGAGVGAVRAHGSNGAFISKWVINKSNFQVVSGADLIQDVKLWTGSTYTTYNAGNTSTLASFGRFCSADLGDVTSYYNPLTGKGTQERIFLNGEESGAEGRGFAHIATGTESGVTYQLPHLGRYSYENAVVSPYPQDKTIVIGLDDATPGQVYVYVGNKSNTGNTIEKAGLFGGRLYGIGVVGMVYEQNSVFAAPNTPFNMIDLGLVQNLTGATLNTNSNNAGVTNFLRPEDGAWDPNRPTDFYFVTTNSSTSPSRMWRLRFNDINNPELGGKIEAVLAGTEGQIMMDNLTIDNHGHILIQEDPGGNNHRAKIWQYKISDDSFKRVADHDSTRFQTGGANFITIDEECSGNIDMQGSLGAGWFLQYDQIHSSQPSPVLEMGQLQAFFNPATAAANPEINIQGNNNSINDGNTTISIANNTDFGMNNIGDAMTKIFTIQNTNSGTLIVSSLQMSGNNAGDFVITGPQTPFVLNGNASQTIAVKFTPAILGTRTAIVNITSSDWDEKNYDFAVSGSGALPEINVQGNSSTIVSGNTSILSSDNTDFGNVQLGNSVNQAFVIQNTSAGTLTISSINISGMNSNEFTIMNPPSFPLTIAGNSSLTFNIKFLPLALGERNGKISIINNDGDENNYNFMIQGKGAIDVGLTDYSEQNSQIIIYPNPTNNNANLKFELENNSNVSVFVFDIQGKLVTETIKNNLSKGEQNISINTSHLSNGEYFVKINTDTKTFTSKLLIAH